jgi:hypothetical protein
MIVHHQNKGMNSPARFRASLTEGIKEQAPICVVPINRLLMIPSDSSHDTLLLGIRFAACVPCQSLRTMEWIASSYSICPPPLP